MVGDTKVKIEANMEEDPWVEIESNDEDVIDKIDEVKEDFIDEVD